ncbi:hypothetical protein ACGFIR_29980 [Micromonospora sp. NPDC049051]|uniref:hypothetical protein n=1 Tax=Micromonospora sp. NPDC049051 TaxID=3364264 RepID=UPI0037203298
MTGNRLPVPWSATDAAFDLAAFTSELRQQGSPESLDLASALTYAQQRVGGPDPGSATDGSVQHAQALVELAVEWQLPHVESWAVSWLAALAVPHLRLRWSSRSHDGRFRRTGRAPQLVNTLSAAPGGVVLGGRDGSLDRWAGEEGVTHVGDLGSPVWVIAADAGRVVGAGPHGRLVSVGSSLSGPPPRRAGIRALALGADGSLACGDEEGHVFVQPPGHPWVTTPVRPGVVVRAMAFHESVLRVAWADGLVTEIDKAATEAGWRSVGQLDRPLATAAWDSTGTRLGWICGSEIGVWHDGTTHQLWEHRGGTCLAWSGDGLLASGGADERIRFGAAVPEAEQEHISTEGAVDALAFAGDHLLVSAHGDEIVHWDLHRTGNDDPSFSASDAITAVATDPADRGRTVAGSRLGTLREFDRYGAVVRQTWRRLGRVHQVVPYDDGWLVAAQHGLHFWQPSTDEVSLKGSVRTLCLAVAVLGDRYAYAAASEVRESTGTRFQMRATVRDIRYGPDGSLAALAEDGQLRVVRTDGSEHVARVDMAARLLELNADEVVLFLPDGSVERLDAHDPYLARRAIVPAATARARHAALLPDGRLAIADAGRGLAILTPDGARSLEATGRLELIATADRRVVVAGGVRLAAYDLMDTPDGDPAETTVPAEVEVKVDVGLKWRLRLPHDDGSVDLEADVVQELRSLADSQEIRRLSEGVRLSGILGDRLWSGGLDRAVDRARGRWPHRPVRIAWSARDGQGSEVPWELLHPSAEPLGWFGDPLVTSVRRVPGAPPAERPEDAPLRPHMLVLRGEDMRRGQDRLRPVDVAFEQLRRRTRRIGVRLLDGMPRVVRQRGDLPDGGTTAHIVHLWAHSGAARVRFTDDFAMTTAECGQALAMLRPRLVILLGCTSAALARELLRHGVEAVIAMRTAVFQETVQPLAEDVTVRALAGEPVDVAFAAALRRYVLTGQPGAAAVPLLHLAAGSTGVLFPRPEGVS